MFFTKYQVAQWQHHFSWGERLVCFLETGIGLLLPDKFLIELLTAAGARHCGFYTKLFTWHFCKSCYCFVIKPTLPGNRNSVFWNNYVWRCSISLAKFAFLSKRFWTPVFSVSRRYKKTQFIFLVHHTVVFVKINLWAFNCCIQFITKAYEMYLILSLIGRGLAHQLIVFQKHIA